MLHQHDSEVMETDTDAEGVGLFLIITFYPRLSFQEKHLNGRTVVWRSEKNARCSGGTRLLERCH